VQTERRSDARQRLYKVFYQLSVRKREIERAIMDFFWKSQAWSWNGFVE
jgi:hypothetical protein